LADFLTDPDSAIKNEAILVDSLITARSDPGGSLNSLASKEGPVGMEILAEIANAVDKIATAVL